MNLFADIVIMTLFRSDNPYSSVSYCLAEEWAKNHRVLYVNHPYSFKDAFQLLCDKKSPFRKAVLRLALGQMVVREEAPNLTVVQPPLTLPVNWLPPGKLYNLLHGLNNQMVQRCVRKIVKQRQIKNFLFYNCYNPFFLPTLPKDTGVAASVYHCIDDISQNPYTAKHGLELEHRAMAEADLTLTTSSTLKKLKEPYARRIALLHNAADISLFSKVRFEQYPQPTELLGRLRPTIGFVGNLDELRVDYGLIKQVAEQHIDKTIVLVGPVNSAEPRTLRLDKMPNVVFTGPKNIKDLPQYLQHIDVALIPYRINTLTSSIYPLKINEYLSAGKAVVSTSFSDDIRGFSPVIYLAKDNDHFVQLIQHALREDGATKIAERTAASAQNTWAARAEQLWQLVARYFPPSLPPIEAKNDAS
jgi:glycosyltransferase involved in cell wall biosynthesis